jgi:hypothetical protein
MSVDISSGPLTVKNPDIGCPLPKGGEEIVASEPRTFPVKEKCIVAAPAVPDTTSPERMMPRERASTRTCIANCTVFINPPCEPMWQVKRWDSFGHSIYRESTENAFDEILVAFVARPSWLFNDNIR